MFGTTKSPVSLDTALKVVPRLSLTSVTVAPGITPPCASFTVPATVDVVACPAAGPADPSMTTEKMSATTRLLPTKRLNINIKHPPGEEMAAREYLPSANQVHPSRVRPCGQFRV